MSDFWLILSLLKCWPFSGSTLFLVRASEKLFSKLRQFGFIGRQAFQKNHIIRNFYDSEDNKIKKKLKKKLTHTFLCKFQMWNYFLLLHIEEKCAKIDFKVIVGQIKTKTFFFKCSFIMRAFIFELVQGTITPSVKLKF